MSAVDRIADGVRSLPGSRAVPADARSGAALALLRPLDGDDVELVLTRRRIDLPTHPGQVSFPGGRREPGEDAVATALREAQEEVGLNPASVTVLGVLPAFYIPPSRFWLEVVVARWDAPHGLTAQPSEVDAILRTRFSELAQRRWWRVARISRGTTWAWELDGEDVLWGATGAVTALLLGMADPDWSEGTDPADLPPSAEVRPWERGNTQVPRPGPARLAVDREIAVDDLDSVPEGPADAPGSQPWTVQAGARLVAQGVAAHPAEGPVTVLVGPGGTGALGLATAVLVAEAGRPVRIVLDRDDPEPVALAAARRAGTEVVGTDGLLAPAGLIVDALIGRGLHGVLRDPARALVRALAEIATPIVSVDVPSGLDPVRGLVGEAVSADVTIALGRPAAGLWHAGLAPFVGDLYVGDPGDPRSGLRRVVGPGDTGGWRE